ncbi:peptide chain release factor N(5)-glutamine methyltransferase [Aquimarina sp. RZ0]|uniref:peptide chain release factor N(5)-glutamine methyltransferase n=1 Tax=Aquimarina sp. RZ0 TaxID=2607730 RepID=UPI0011F0ED68|nr:peptide chain release factor N(5)-glutamine methyltransferase [Aquimarina sp. RZ0]KAA1247074.1 peptide chain release factor N(5)-glutamine methyltransferase [Aquimarina sp. RZ0]
MKIKELRKDFLETLSGLYDSEEIVAFFYILSENFLGLRRVDVVLALDQIVSDQQLLDFMNAKKCLENQHPIQYITGDTEFYGLSFAVNQSVLIPRPETEELVDWIIQDFKALEKEKTLKILDIGTGSGCIAISLAKNLKNAKVYAMDISEKAIDTARGNAIANNVEVHFIVSNVLRLDKLPHSFDIVVSNPPYVRELEKKDIKPNVLNNEPHNALFVPDDDALIFYKKITELAKLDLQDDGALYFEINQYLGFETRQMIENQGFPSVTLRKDLCANDRMIRAKLS